MKDVKLHTVFCIPQLNAVSSRLQEYRKVEFGTHTAWCCGAINGHSACAGAVDPEAHSASAAECGEFSKPAVTTSNLIDVVVCGAHLTGQPLNWQLTERHAVLKSITKNSSDYKLYALADGKRPGMIRVDNEGESIEVEVWSVPSEYFGSFVAGIPAPLGIGKVELESGEWVSGFICDGYGLEGAKDITIYGGWKAWLQK